MSSRARLAVKQRSKDAAVEAHCKALNSDFVPHNIQAQLVDGKYRHFGTRPGCVEQSSNRKIFAREHCAAAALPPRAPLAVRDRLTVRRVTGALAVARPYRACL